MYSSDKIPFHLHIFTLISHILIITKSMLFYFIKDATGMGYPNNVRKVMNVQIGTRFYNSERVSTLNNDSVLEWWKDEVSIHVSLIKWQRGEIRYHSCSFKWKTLLRCYGSSYCDLIKAAGVRI